MSHGGGTLAGPSGFDKGNAKASSGNGKQHTLPAHPAHNLLNFESIDSHWDVKNAKATPTRLWGKTKQTRWRGEERPDGTAEHWLNGEFWNVDSNITKWGEHEVRRNASSANHDVHRHDQITRTVLPPQPSISGREKEPRMCLSGVVSPDSNFLEVWGFDLGKRDRQGNVCSTFHPPSKGEHFRSLRSYNRNRERMTESFRSMRRTASEPGKVQMHTLRPEDIGGEAGEVSIGDDFSMETAGRTHGARSCRYWDSYDHVVRREATKMSCGIHSPAHKYHPDHPVKDGIEMSPAAIYTRKYQQGGEDALRKFVGSSQRLSATT